MIRRCDAVLTVSDGIADRLVELHGLRRRPAVVRNVPDVTGPPAGGRLRRVLGIGAAPLVLHQGAPARHRGCEQLVRAMGSVPDAQLVFLGDEGDPGYVAGLTRLARECGLGERVHFVPSVPLEELLGQTAEADVGVSLLEDVCENHRLALPNKVFEYVAAGVPVVASRLPEVTQLVEGRGIGWTANASDPADVARAIREALAGRDEPGLAGEPDARPRGSSPGRASSSGCSASTRRSSPRAGGRLCSCATPAPTTRGCYGRRGCWSGSATTWAWWRSHRQRSSGAAR